MQPFCADLCKAMLPFRFDLGRFENEMEAEGKRKERDKIDEIMDMVDKTGVRVILPMTGVVDSLMAS